MARSARIPSPTAALAKRLAALIGGWFLVVLGAVALVLPGPGLLLIVAGLALLSTQYRWAKRLLQPAKARAYRLSAKGVQTWPRIALSIFFGLSLVAIGILWGIDFSTPAWWPVSPRWWLFGGWGTGVTIITSGGLVLALIVYSFVRFRPRPDVPRHAAR